MTDDVMRELESDELLDMLPKEIPPHEEVTKEGDDPMNEAYFTEVDRDGCSHCGEGRQWRVVGPDGMADSVCYDYEPDAERHAESLNAAFDQGVRSTNARISALTAENERLQSQLELVRERLGGAPEINPSNYDHDEVVELNSACILAYFLAGGKPTNEEVPEYKQAQAELLDAARGRRG